MASIAPQPFLNHGARQRNDIDLFCAGIQQRGGTGRNGAAGSKDIIREQQRAVGNQFRTAHLEGICYPGHTINDIEAGALACSRFRTHQALGFQWLGKLAGEPFGYHRGLIEASFAQPIAMQRHGQQQLATGELLCSETVEVIGEPAAEVRAGFQVEDAGPQRALVTGYRARKMEMPLTAAVAIWRRGYAFGQRQRITAALANIGIIKRGNRIPAGLAGNTVGALLH